MKKIIAMLLALCMVFALCACGQPAAPAADQPAAAGDAPAAEDAAPAEDTVTVMVPPVSSTYQDDIDTWAAEFTAMYPNIKIEVIKTSWDDHNGKLSTMANAGEAPDIAEVILLHHRHRMSTWASALTSRPVHGCRAGWPTTIRTRWTTCPSRTLSTACPSTSPFSPSAPTREMLEAAGADVAKIQTEGWTYEEFLEVIKNGTTADCFGFAFANSGVTAVRRSSTSWVLCRWPHQRLHSLS